MNLNVDCNYTSVYISSYNYKDKLELHGPVFVDIIK